MRLFAFRRVAVFSRCESHWVRFPPLAGHLDHVPLSGVTWTTVSSTLR